MYEFRERRAGGRVACRVAAYQVEDHTMRVFETVEVSETGCLLRGVVGDLPAPGSKLVLHLRLPGLPGPIEVAGPVVREVGGWPEVFAVTFADIEAAARCSLRAFVAEVRYGHACRDAVRRSEKNSSQSA